LFSFSLLIHVLIQNFWKPAVLRSTFHKYFHEGKGDFNFA
jgi:hypothetical protein